jgi:hypothetical protein
MPATDDTAHSSALLVCAWLATQLSSAALNKADPATALLARRARMFLYLLMLVQPRLPPAARRAAHLVVLAVVWRVVMLRVMGSVTARITQAVTHSAATAVSSLALGSVASSRVEISNRKLPKSSAPKLRSKL